MNRFEKRRHAIDQAIGEHINQYKAIYKKADEDDRDPTDDERLEIESELKAIETLKTEREDVEANIKTLEHVDDLGRKLGPAVPQSESIAGGVNLQNGLAGVQVMPQRTKSLGEMFVENKAVQEISEKFKSGVREKFNTGAIELKGTLLEGVGAPGAGTGGGLIPIPQVIPGVVEKLFQPLRVADLLLSGQATSSSIRYVIEGTATSGAAGVAEGGAKPQSTFALSTSDMPVTKVAHSTKTSDEMLEDVQQLQSYINGRMSLFVDIEEERQIVSGAGSGSNELKGILNSGINTYARGTVDNNAVALFRALNGQRGSAFLEPDFIVMNPANYAATRLLQDANQQFYGVGPFGNTYGNTLNEGNGGQIGGPTDYLWQKPVIVTTAIGAGTALIGTRVAAQLWSRGGVNIAATNSNEDDFLHDLVAIRAEKREALTVYRPAAFTAVTGLSA